MSKIRIDVPGYETFDSFLWTLEFKGGVSVREATDLEIKRIGANIRISKVEDDEQVGPSVVMVGARNVSAELETALQRDTEKPETENQEALEYSADRLNEIAEEGGIKAIRKIADIYGIKGISINSMIDEIVKAQKEA